jgi:mono/diheme cytochrome c family protein
LGRIGLSLGLLAVLACGAARAEDLDAGKSAEKLFADSCAACHKSARGLTKRNYLTLYFFLRDHYASNSTSAWALTSYLESVDGTPRSRPRKPSAKAERAERTSAPPQINWTPGTPPRPPAGVPQR